MQTAYDGLQLLFYIIQGSNCYGKNNSNDRDCILFLDMNHDRSDADRYVIDSQLDVKPSINSSQVQVQVQVHNGGHDGDGLIAMMSMIVIMFR